MNMTSLLSFGRKQEKKSAHNIFFDLYNKYPQASFAFSILVAFIGIAFLLAFPWLAVTHLLTFYDGLLTATQWQDWINIVLHLLIAILAAAFSWAVLRLEFHKPQGLEVNKEKFPHLLKFIEELQAEFAQPNIDRIILRDNYELKVVKTPHNRIPFITTTTLIIGLPVLQTMSPLYFRALLARRIGQLSTQHTPVTTRLYFLDDIWQQFQFSCKKSANPFAHTLYYFFQLYTPFYHHVLTPLLQQEELEADRYGMDVINDRDMVECIVYEEVVKQFLQKKFWPKIHHLARRHDKPTFYPFSQLTKVVKAGITDEEVSSAIQAALKIDMDCPNAEPSLQKRLNHLGHAKPLPPKRLQRTAAEYYLGSSLEKIIQLFDKRWMAKLNKKLQRV